MTPKSLLRLPAATSNIGRAVPLVDSNRLLMIRKSRTRPRVERVVVCSGKVYYDLVEGRKTAGKQRVSLVRFEQFYPFPLNRLREVLAKLPKCEATGLGAGRAQEYGWLDLRRPAFGKRHAPPAAARYTSGALLPPVPQLAHMQFTRRSMPASCKKLLAYDGARCSEIVVDDRHLDLAADRLSSVVPPCFASQSA